MIALLQAKAAGLWSRSQIRNNVLAGVVVGIVALPLAMAFAIASGARPEQGLYTAIVAALLTSIFGGTRVQISGPTGAFVAVLAIITAQHGIAGLQIATLMAGVILLVFGFARLGAVIKYIPDPVIAGFTAGIGVIIFVGQWKDFLGLTPAASGLRFHEKLWSLIEALPTINPATAGLALLALGILIFGARYLRRIPAPLIALIVVTAVQAVFQFKGVATIGSAFGGIPRTLPALSFPSLDLARVLSLVGPAFTIALLGAIESLLSAVVADGMAGTRHDSNQELIGQGIANIVAPLFGGFAATGAIARTATNIRNGATSPLAGMVHSVFLILVILLLAPLASAIPLCCLSAILFVVAWNMSELPHVVRLVRGAPKVDVGILAADVFLDRVRRSRGRRQRGGDSRGAVLHAADGGFGQCRTAERIAARLRHAGFACDAGEQRRRRLQHRGTGVLRRRREARAHAGAYPSAGDHAHLAHGQCTLRRCHRDLRDRGNHHRLQAARRHRAAG